MIRVIDIEVSNARLCQCRGTVNGHHFGRSGGVFQRLLAVSVQVVHHTLQNGVELCRTGCCLLAVGPFALYCSCRLGSVTVLLFAVARIIFWLLLPWYPLLRSLAFVTGGFLFPHSKWEDSDCRAGFWQCSAWGFSYLAVISFSYWENRNVSFRWSVRQGDLQQSQSWKLFF